MSQQKIVKAVKAVKVGAKRCKLFLSGNKLIYSDGDHDLELLLDAPNTAENDRAWDSVAAFELDVEQVALFDELSLLGANAVPGGQAVSADEWARVAWCSLATEENYSRYSLAGVCFDGQNVVATNGKILFRSTINANFGGKLDRIVHARTVKTVSALIKLFRDTSVLVFFHPNKIEVAGENWRLVARLIEGRFPNWSQIPPHTQPNAASGFDFVFRDSFLDEAKAAIKRHDLGVKAGTVDKTVLPTIEVSRSSWATPVKFDPRFIVDGLKLLQGSKTITARIEVVGNPWLTIFGDNDSFAVISPIG
jgi:hypothetical protein